MTVTGFDFISSVLHDLWLEKRMEERFDIEYGFTSVFAKEKGVNYGRLLVLLSSHGDNLMVRIT